MRTIPLTRGKESIVDDEDYESLSKLKWWVLRVRKSDLWYAVRKGSDRKVIMMHRVLTNCPAGKFVDHKDSNTLNNQKCNLRVCTALENGWAKRGWKLKNTGMKGVFWHSRDKVFHASIRVRGLLLHLGNFRDKGDAKTAYDTAAIKYFGEFAITNQMLSERRA